MRRVRVRVCVSVCELLLCRVAIAARGDWCRRLIFPSDSPCGDVCIDSSHSRADRYGIMQVTVMPYAWTGTLTDFLLLILSHGWHVCFKNNFFIYIFLLIQVPHPRANTHTKKLVSA